MGRMTGVRIFVYEHLDQVPEGQVITVPQLATLSDVSGARNAIKRILKHDESIDHPYWRVVDEDGSLLETVGGDTSFQEEKLSAEGVDVSGGKVDVEQYRFEPTKIES